jgi:cytoskeletal protein RodZ
MAVQWNVHSGAEVFGPWSASRIRDELRAGRIDAFDLVAVVGSSVKRPLVEVDEIFETVGVQAAAIVSDVVEEPPADNAIINAPEMPVRQEASLGVVNEDRPRVFEALAAPQRIKAPAGRQHGRRAFGGSANRGKEPGKAGRKSYLILLPGAGSKGPFTSKDVLILWYAKQLAAGTYIQRVGDAKRIEISRFASFYERAAPSGMAFIGQASLAHSAKDRSMLWLITAILVSVGILAGAIYWRARRLPVSLIAPPGVSMSFTGNDDEGITANPVMETPAGPAPEKAAALPGKSTITSLPKSAVKTDRAERTAAPKRVRQSARRKPYKQPVTASPSASQPMTQVAPQVAPQAVSQPRQVSPPKAAAPASAPKPKAGPADGVNVTLTGYSFNVELLNACEMKCKIPMRGPKGPVTAVFFKEAIGAGLAAKASSVTITGTARRDPGTGAILIFVRSFN